MSRFEKSSTGMLHFYLLHQCLRKVKKSQAKLLILGRAAGSKLSKALLMNGQTIVVNVIFFVFDL